jgi:hypothetical protein
MANLSKHIWEGWTVGDFVNRLNEELPMIQSGNSWRKPLKTKAELKDWCKDNQPHYKKHIPDVVNHLAKQYNLK